jgi:D-alanine-D-alanine ligase
MKIGITYDLKASVPHGPDVPDDADEEFDSPETIEALAKVLRGMGHTIALLSDGREFLERVLAEKPDLVFNFAEGHGISRSREARVPAVLDMLGIPYTGSDPFTMAVTLDKDCAKTLVAAAGIAVPAGFALEPQAPLSSLPELKYPLVIKPAWEGSSKGIRNQCLVSNSKEIPAIVASLRRTLAQTVLLEEYIDGEELTVGLYGNANPSILGILRVVPNVPTERFIYSLEVKRDWRNRVSYQCPPQLPQEQLEAVSSAARTVFRVLGCRDVARIDFRLRGGVPYFLEVNPLPGLHPVESDLAMIARLIGWTYDRLVRTIVNAALQRLGLTGEPGA